MPEWITVKEAAGILGVKLDRVRKLCRGGVITAAKFGDVWRVDRESVMAYKKTYRKPGPKPAVTITLNPSTAQAIRAERPTGDEEGQELAY